MTTITGNLIGVSKELAAAREQVYCTNLEMENMLTRNCNSMSKERANELYYNKLEMVAYAQLRQWPEIQGIKSKQWVLAKKLGKTRIEMELEISRQIPIKF